MRGPKRVYITFPGIGLCRYRIVLETALRVVVSMKVLQMCDCKFSGLSAFNHIETLVFSVFG